MFGELSENYWKTDKIKFEDNYMIIKQKTVPHNFTNFRKLLVEFLVNFRQAVDDSYLNKYLTILFQNFSQVHLSKHEKNQWLLI